MKLLAIAVLLASAGFSASWDGTKGDVTLTTSSRAADPNNHNLFVQSATLVTVKCSNPSVTAIRVTLRYHNGNFNGSDSRIIQLNPLHSGTAVFNVSEELITGAPIVTLLFDGISMQF